LVDNKARADPGIKLGAVFDGMCHGSTFELALIDATSRVHSVQIAA